MALQFGTRFWPRMQDGVTRLGERYFNPIWELIDKRLADLENLRTSWIKATEDLIAFGLQRIDAVLAPAFERVGRIAELGFLRANSTTTETLVVDEVSTFVIADPDQRELFHASAFVAITRPDNQDDFAIGRVLSYVKTTGILDVEIKLIEGSAGPFSDWEIVTGSGVTIYMKAQADAAKADRILAQQARDAAVAAKNATNAAAILIANGPVSSVNGKVGSVTLTPADVGAMSSAEGEALATSITDDVDAALAAQNTAVNAALAGKETKWSAPSVVAADATFADRQHLIGDTSAAARTFTLPLAPAAGASVRAQRRGANNLVIARNGQTIRGEAADFTMDINHQCFEFRFTGTTWEWF